MCNLNCGKASNLTYCKCELSKVDLDTLSTISFTYHPSSNRRIISRPETVLTFTNNAGNHSKSPRIVA